MSVRVVRIVSLWLQEGADPAAFEAFERKAAVIMARHGGRIDRAVRMGGAGEDPPFEVHLVSFPDAQSFEAYRADPATLALRAERERVIRRTQVLEGVEAGPYEP
jgi:uncharacterized protein (DUF1330 family)